MPPTKPATVAIVYVGEAPSRLIAVEGGAILAEHGVPVEVPEPLGKSLLEQDVFEPARVKRTTQEVN